MYSGSSNNNRGAGGGAGAGAGAGSSPSSLSLSARLKQKRAARSGTLGATGNSVTFASDTTSLASPMVAGPLHSASVASMGSLTDLGGSVGAWHSTSTGILDGGRGSSPVRRARGGSSPASRGSRSSPSKSRRSAGRSGRRGHGGRAPMARPPQRVGADTACGFDLDRFVSAVPAAILCGVCHQVPQDGVETRCAHPFCASGIRRHITDCAVGAALCPTCKREVTIEGLQQPTGLVATLYSKLRIRCVFSGRGCSYVGTLDSIREHELQCGFVETRCLHQDCTHTCSQRELADHMVHCPFAPMQCERCGGATRAADRKKHKCTDDLLRRTYMAMEAMNATLATVQRSFDERMDALVEKVDRRMTAMDLRLERMQKVIEDSANADPSGRVAETHAELMRVASLYRLQSHAGEYVSPAPPPGSIAPPPEGTWTCCHVKGKFSWCLASTQYNLGSEQ